MSNMDFKSKIYDELSNILTMYDENLATGDDLYNILCKIQSNWDYITSYQI